MKLNSPISIGGLELRNRIVMPPMVVFGLAQEGYVTPSHLHHYRTRAAAGTGLIIIEATCVSSSGRLSVDQLGLWKDEHIQGMEHLADVCHIHGVPALVQLHHAGMSTDPATGRKMGPVAMENYRGHRVHALSEEELETIIASFAQAARRAAEAGMDGVELHGCHNYLIDQFVNPRVNTRTDVWGGSLENRTRLPRRIVEEIRKVTPDSFVITMRMGANAPTLEEGCALADAYIDMGIQALNVSFSIQDDFDVPADYPYNRLSYLGTVIAKHVAGRVPVMAVGGIDTCQIAEDLLENYGVDLVNVGHGMLADDRWSETALRGEAPQYPCLRCKDCRWPQVCPQLNRRREADSHCAI